MTILLQIEGPKETFPVLKTSDVISMYRLVIVLSGEVICSKLFIVIRYIFSGGFQGPQRLRGLPPQFFKVYKHSTTTSYNLLAQVVDVVFSIYRFKLRFGRGPSARCITPAPRPPPGLGFAQGVYRRDRPIQIVSLGNSYAPAPCPVSHIHATAAVRAGSVPEINQGYKYYI